MPLRFSNLSRKGREERPQRTLRRTSTLRPQRATFADSHLRRRSHAPASIPVKRSPLPAMTPVTSYALKFHTDGRCIRYGHTCIWTTCGASSLTSSVLRRDFPGRGAGRGQRSARHHLSHSCHRGPDRPSLHSTGTITAWPPCEPPISRSSIKVLSSAIFKAFFAPTGPSSNSPSSSTPADRSLLDSAKKSPTSSK